MSGIIKREDLNQISMKVILHAGNTRSITMQIMDKLSQNTVSIEDITQLLTKAHRELTVAHNFQTDMIQNEAQGKEIPFSVLFIHAQDTLMSVQSELLMTEKIIKIVHSMGGKQHA